MCSDTSTRRSFLKASGLSVMGAGIAHLTEQLPVQAAAVGETAFENTSLTADQALKKMLDGNLRFQRGTLLWPDQTLDRRTEVAKKQNPFAIVFSCVDSRVPPELVFDQGLGDIFTIRTAAHVIDKAALGSLEYGVAELGIPLLVVMGHERCGAVNATISAVDQHEKAPGSIEALVDYIRPSVLEARGTGAARLDDAIRLNTVRTVKILRTSTIIKTALDKKKLSLIGARYDLDTGVVSMVAV